MNTQAIIALIVGLLTELFPNDKLVAVLAAMVPKIIKAVAESTAGEAFEVPQFPLSVDGHAGEMGPLPWKPTV